MKEVILYGYESCPYCKMTKAHLQEKGIEYTNFDVHEDDSKATELETLTGQTAVPVLVIRQDGDEQIVIGYDPQAIDEALKL
jgi:NADH-dependent peroxiredoxin subunit F